MQVQIDTDIRLNQYLTYIETKVSLQDRLLQLFVEANEFSLLNLNPIFISTRTKRFSSSDSIIELIINIDPEIQISERTVNDIVTLFGDIGGFQSIILGLIGLLVGSFPSKLFDINKA